MTAIDHSLAVLLALVCLAAPFLAVDPARYSRMELYQAAVATNVLFAALPLIACYASTRPLADFGLAGWTGQREAALVAGGAWAAAAVAIVMLARRGLLRAPLARVYRHYLWIIPRNRAELAASWAASLFAGAGEEIAFRGFLLAYGAALAGDGVGLIASSLLFGLAHSYQRLRGMVFATLAGMLLGAVYLATGSLLLVMAMHAIWDMASFATGRIVLAGEGVAGGEEAGQAGQASTGEAERAPL